MKKFLTLVLALAMVCSLSATAFADGGTTTLTVEVPSAAEPSYTLHIPANTTLTYGNTEKQEISGKLYVENVQNASQVYFLAPFTDLVNTANSSDKILMELWVKMDYESYPTSIVDPATGKVDGNIWAIYDVSWGIGDEYEGMTFYAEVDDWSGATPGATYQAVITFQVWAE